MRSKVPSVTEDTIDKLNEQIKALTGDVIPAYEEAYQERWAVLEKERKAKKAMDAQSRDFMRRLRRIFRRIVGRDNWTEMDFSPACGYVIQHGQNPCKKQPYVRVSILVSGTGVRIEKQIWIRSAGNILSAARALRRMIEAYYLHRGTD